MVASTELKKVFLALLSKVNNVVSIVLTTKKVAVMHLLGMRRLTSPYSATDAVMRVS